MLNFERLKELKAEFEQIRKYNDRHYMSTITENDVIELIDEAIARHSVTSEEVAEAINEFESAFDEEVIVNGLIGVCSEYQFKVETIDLAITALQAYQPWIPVSERLPTEEDADKKGLVLTYDKLENQETFPRDCIEEWNATKDNKITHWKSLSEPPKGE
jgi:hypothetical protein